MNEEKEILTNFILDDYLKEDIAINVSESGNLNKLYWLQLSLAAVIATLGLLQGSIPVVIGVMLIAPLLRPIQSFSFAITTSQSKKSWKSFKNILGSIILVIILGIIITYLIPIKLENSEILSRTNPNILDFFIASFSAVIAFLALVYKKKLSDSIAGVAMAASLLPPLSVIGIEIAYHNYFLAWGALLLFITNLVAIILIGIFLFFVFGFRPHQNDDKNKFKKNILILLIFISIISLPLISSIISLKNNINQEVYLRNEINNNLIKDKINIKKITIENKNNITKIILEGEYYNENDFELIKKKINYIKSNLNKDKNILIETKLILIKKIEI